jgi:hypothetical protein
MNIFYDSTSFDEPVYCCIGEGYMYFADTLENLVVVLNTEWKLDKHMVG